MIEFFKSFFSELSKPLWAEILDQFLHFIVAVGGVYALVASALRYKPALFLFERELAIAACVIVMLLAFIRELSQHEWNWRRVGRRDLLFFSIGCVVAVII